MYNLGEEMVIIWPQSQVWHGYNPIPRFYDSTDAGITSQFSSRVNGQPIHSLNPIFISDQRCIEAALTGRNQNRDSTATKSQQ